MKMKKKFLNIDELRILCESLKLPSNGLKHELIERLVNASESESVSSSDVADLPLSNDNGTQTEPPPPQNESKSMQTRQQQITGRFWKKTFAVLVFVIFVLILWCFLFKEENLFLLLIIIAISDLTDIHCHIEI